MNEPPPVGGGSRDCRCFPRQRKRLPSPAPWAAIAVPIGVRARALHRVRHGTTKAAPVSSPRRGPSRHFHV